MSFTNSESTYLSSAAKSISNGFDQFLGMSVSKTATSTASDAVLSASSQIILRSQAEETFNLVKKIVGISVASVAVFGSAFYFGYNFAKKRHRFHVREADKNDQVMGKFLSSFLFYLF
jgi:hypothetical protein